MSYGYIPYWSERYGHAPSGVRVWPLALVAAWLAFWLSGCSSPDITPELPVPAKHCCTPPLRLADTMRGPCGTEVLTPDAIYRERLRCLAGHGSFTVWGPTYVSCDRAGAFKSWSWGVSNVPDWRRGVAL